MKLISLNCWLGQELEELMGFVLEQKKTTDFFCLQEIANFEEFLGRAPYREVDLFGELQGILGDEFDVLFSPQNTPVTMLNGKLDYLAHSGDAIFYRKETKVLDKEARELFEFEFEELTYAGSYKVMLQIIDFKIDEKKLCIVNIHGTPYPVNKLDSEKRLRQSKEIIKLKEEKKEFEMIVSGDFNLLPEAESIQMLNRRFRNLIDEFGIENTRSILTGFRGKAGEQKFADYTFVTPGIKVQSYEVPDLVVSDHLPLILEFKV